jgi:hypothetical protein
MRVLSRYSRKPIYSEEWRQIISGSPHTDAKDSGGWFENRDKAPKAQPFSVNETLGFGHLAEGGGGDE